MQESSSHTHQCANEYNSFVCLTFESYNSIKSQLPKVQVISVIKGCFVKVIYFAWMVKMLIYDLVVLA